jgi:serine/threonine protein kinase
VRGDEDFFERAQTEIDLLATLGAAGGHKHGIVELLDAFVHECKKGVKHQCMVFELLPRSLMSALTARTCFALDEVASIGRSILRALVFLGREHGACKQSIIHADLKPDNIMLVRGHHAVKLIDFGCASYSNDVVSV